MCTKSERDYHMPPAEAAEVAQAFDPTPTVRKITNATGFVRYCEDCGQRLDTGFSEHYCPGPQETR